MGATVEISADLRQAAPRSIGGETDEDLVVGVRAGVDAAFEEIYDRYARGLFAFCMHMLQSREAAEDALQLTLVSAYRAMRDGTSEIVLRPWLYTIARNRCLSEIRARRETEPWTSDDPPSRFSDLSDEVQRREDLRDMVDEIRRLPDDQRAALVLFELGDNSHHQIADIIGVRPSKVKALVFQAREALARGRLARDHPCTEIREQIATTQGVILPRSMTRAHISRCPSCAAYESETRHQRAALALIIPVPLAIGLKSTVLGAVLHGGAAAGAGAGAGGAGGGRWRAGGGDRGWCHERWRRRGRRRCDQRRSCGGRRRGCGGRRERDRRSGNCRHWRRRRRRRGRRRWRDRRRGRDRGLRGDQHRSGGGCRRLGRGGLRWADGRQRERRRRRGEDACHRGGRARGLPRGRFRCPAAPAAAVGTRRWWSGRPSPGHGRRRTRHRPPQPPIQPCFCRVRGRRRRRRRRV